MSNEVINVQQLCKSYEGRLVVDHVDLSVAQGKIYGFLGPNGSGKTTTIRMICGLLTPDSGDGHCLGYDIQSQAALIKREVGYMTQHFSLYKDLSIYENLDFVARLYRLNQRKQRIRKAIERLGISRRRQRQLAGNLSGGWRQRLALTAAILHEPKLLLLDEPTAGVDPKARRDFWDEINRLSAQGITTLVSTHYMDEAERCHELAYIAYGKLLVRGKKEDVINHAAIETWEVSGNHLSDLAEALRANPNINQISVFGQRLHVSGKIGSNLDRVLESYQHQSGQAWQKITPSLEDVFIHLMQEREDNFSA